MRRLAVAALAAAAAAVAAAPAGAARECEGFLVCVPVAGPWVVVPPGGGAQRPRVEYQLTCPRGYVVAGLDAELSDRAIDVAFLGAIGTPVAPGVATSRSVVFVGRYVGTTARSPSFRPRAGCVPASGGGGTRVPTARDAFPPGRPAVRRVQTVRVGPGERRVTASCAAGERLVGAGHAFGFFTRTPPSASLVAGVGGRRFAAGRRVTVAVRGDAELEGVRAVVQVQALCARVR